MNNFADKLKTILDEKNITQYRLSKLSGISQSTLSDILTGKKSPSGLTLQKICTALGVSMAEFDCPELHFKLINTVKTEKSNTNSEALVSKAEFNEITDTQPQEKKYPPFKDLFWARAEQLDLTDRQKKAAEAFKQLPVEEQRELILKFATSENNVYTINTNKIISNIKKLSPEKQKAIAQLIESMVQSD